MRKVESYIFVTPVKKKKLSFFFWGGGGGSTMYFLKCNGLRCNDVNTDKNMS